MSTWNLLPSLIGMYLRRHSHDEKKTLMSWSDWRAAHMENDRNNQAVLMVSSDFSWVYQEVPRRRCKCGRSKKLKIHSRRRAAPPGTPMKNSPTPSRPPDRCGYFPHGRCYNQTMGTGIIFISWLVGGFVRGLQVGGWSVFFCK